MNLQFLKHKGFFSTLFAALILIAIPIVTDMYKDSFVGATGHFKIMGGLSIILAIGLLRKWKFAWYLTGIFVGFILFATIFMAFAMGINYAIAYSLLFITLIVLAVLLKSKSVAFYLNSK
ncbi:hypothetical protein BZG02_05275 [Labilibaculum filiforme]|uniref:Uncharacterized protein n=1 Tax=Labilibaculum filiforme TaxID=1940526 RepID=A0A2N3I1N9_9BACT|nr:hypothetical protein [Labilibaculum filiforme]PKQ64234.1 hypothetical protein BZG02_05275 [Labilibaculum filiforme]